MSEAPRDPLFELVSYLVSCARLSLDEAPRYGSLRLLIGASRLIEAAETVEGLEVDDEIRAFKRSIDENALLVMNEFPAFEAWLTALLRDVAEEATRRNLRLPA